MTWIRRTDPAAPHRCQPPIHTVEFTIPSASLDPPAGPPQPDFMDGPDGELGDAWRCPCSRLWVIGRARDAAARLVTGLEWRPASLWLRLVVAIGRLLVPPPRRTPGKLPVDLGPPHFGDPRSQAFMVDCLPARLPDPGPPLPPGSLLITPCGMAGDDTATLSRFNAERARGIVHTPEWQAAMAELQRLYDERR
jgi:hypothetical protein